MPLLDKYTLYSNLVYYRHNGDDERYDSLLPLCATAPVSLGLLNNQSPFLSIFHLLHSLLYLQYFQVCYHPDKNIMKLKVKLKTLEL